MAFTESAYFELFHVSMTNMKNGTASEDDVLFIRSCEDAMVFNDYAIEVSVASAIKEYYHAHVPNGARIFAKLNGAHDAFTKRVRVALEKCRSKTSGPEDRIFIQLYLDGFYDDKKLETDIHAYFKEEQIERKKAERAEVSRAKIENLGKPTLVIKGLSQSEIDAVYKTIKTQFPQATVEFCPVLIGTNVFKKVASIRLTGQVAEYLFDKSAFRVIYDDESEDEMTLAEVQKHLEEPEWTLIERVEWIETSGRRSHSFGRMLREMVDGRDDVREKLPRIFNDVAHAKIRLSHVEKIGPGLWSHLGDNEAEKWFYAKRILAAVEDAL